MHQTINKKTCTFYNKKKSCVYVEPFICTEIDKIINNNNNNLNQSHEIQ